MNGKRVLKMSERIVSYDFDIQSLVAVDAPYGTNPNTLIDKVMNKIAERARDGEIEVFCENTFDRETGSYEEIPVEWYKNI